MLERSLKYIVRLPAVDKRTRDAFAALDIAGYNYMSGRYRTDARRHPRRVIVGSETNPTETVAIWQEIENLPHVIGDFTWTGWDYIGEAGYAAVRYDERRQIYAPWPALLAGMPVIDITGHRQTQSYLNEIAWHRRSGPHLAVQPVNHAGEKRSARAGRTDSIRSWSWEGCEGRVATVEVYADADRVDLLLDGHLVGSEPAGSGPGLPGEVLPALPAGSAPGRRLRPNRSGDRAGHPHERRSRTAPAGVDPSATGCVADGADLAYLPIELTDDAGIVRPARRSGGHRVR